jgi:hypothetical protein
MGWFGVIFEALKRVLFEYLTKDSLLKVSFDL